MRRESKRVAHFGKPGPMRDRLIAAVKRGKKTATSSLLDELEADEEPMPVVGDRLAVVDSEERQIAVIELTAVEVIRMGDVGLELVQAEGEGFKTVEDWRREHERFWREEVRSEPLGNDTRVIFERFRLVSD